MNRRTFMAGASVAAGSAPVLASTLTASPAVALGRDSLAAHHGRAVRLEGWLTPSGEGPGHYFDLSAAHGAAGETVRIYPADTRHMRAGRVRLTGALSVGHFRDEVTGRDARAVLIDARPA